MASQYPRHRVAVVVGDKRVRDELESIISSSLEHECVATCSMAIEAVERLSRIIPDMVLVDIDLPERSSIACVHELRRRQPALQITMLVPHEDHGLLYKCLAAGASGYLLESSSATSLNNSISEFKMFRSNMSAFVALKILKEFHANEEGPDLPIANLSRIERTILNLVARDELPTYSELGLPMSRVAIHLHIIYQKLQHRMSREMDFSSSIGNRLLNRHQPFLNGGEHRQ